MQCFWKDRERETDIYGQIEPLTPFNVTLVGIFAINGGLPRSKRNTTENVKLIGLVAPPQKGEKVDEVYDCWLRPVIYRLVSEINFYYLHGKETFDSYAKSHISIKAILGFLVADSRGMAEIREFMGPGATAGCGMCLKAPKDFPHYDTAATPRTYKDTKAIALLVSDSQAVHIH